MLSCFWNGKFGKLGRGRALVNLCCNWHFARADEWESVRSLACAELASGSRFSPPRQSAVLVGPAARSNGVAWRKDIATNATRAPVADAAIITMADGGVRTTSRQASTAAAMAATSFRYLR